MTRELILSLPYVTEGLPGVGGRIRGRTSDFVVEELSTVTPSGDGDHLYVSLTKEGLTTREVQLQLAELFRLKPSAVGTGGLKDKEARTTQIFSLLFEKEKYRAEEASVIIENNIVVKVNWAKYHKVKFRAGHLFGNRFKVRISEITLPKLEAFDRATLIAEEIQRMGIPNYFGEQRIGRRGKNAKAGWDIINGKRLGDKWLSRYLITAYQSYICNRYLAERVDRGLFDRLIHGDVIERHDTGERSHVTDVSAHQQDYLDKSISFTAPMFGSKMVRASEDAGVLEAEVFSESGLSNKTLKKHRINGTRRRGRLIPNIGIREYSGGLELEFTLHKGGFATTLLREFMKAR